jgi:hypothetical protein
MRASRFAAGASGVTFGAMFVAAFLANLAARAQAVDVARAHSFVSGSPPGDARADRGGGGRTGLVHERLPAGRLVVEWRAPLGIALRRAPVIGPDGDIEVASTEGEVVTLASDGTERARVTTGASDPSPLALLAAGDLVFVDGAGEAVGVRAGRTTFRSRFGRAGAVGPGPLPMEDGGVIVATEHEMALLDATGVERARTTLVDPIRAPLVSARGHILAITTGGAVWSWRPGALAAERVAAFGGPVDGGAVLAGDGTLLGALAEQGLIVAVDLVQRTSTVLAATSEGLWLGPPSIAGGVVFVPLLTAGAEMVVGIGPSGNEISRVVLGGRAGGPTVDAGPIPLAVPPHTPPLVDAWGTFFFATFAGDIGAASDVRSANASVELLADVCGSREPTRGGARQPTPDPAVVGLAASGAGRVVAACADGTVVAIRGALPE